MNIYKKITLILTITSIALPAFGMEGDSGNRGFFSSLWNAAKEHPVIAGSLAVATIVGGASLWAYRKSSLNNQLFKAVCRNSVEEVQQLIKKGADIHAQFAYNRTALHEAARGGFVQVTAALLAAGADKEAHCRAGTPLHFAVGAGHAQVIRCLLNAGADVHALNSFNETALHVAARKGNAAVVACLLQAGAQVNAQNYDNETPLYYAAKEGHVAIVRSLLKAGSTDIQSSLYVAAEHGHAGIVQLLLQEIDPATKLELFSLLDGACGDALQTALVRGHIAVVKILLETCLTLRNKNLMMSGLLASAISHNRVEMVRFLLEQDYNCPTSVPSKGSRDRILTALCAFNKMPIALPKEVKNKILSFLPEDIWNQEHARILINAGANLRDMVEMCPLHCFVKMYAETEDTYKGAFLEQVVDAVVDSRLQQISRWLADFVIVVNLQNQHVDPLILSLCDPDNIEQHRLPIEKHVRKLFE